MRCNTIISIVLAALASVCLCSCRKEAPKASKVIISESRISLKPGQTIALTATVEPENCESTVEWSSSDRNVVRCNQGVLEGISAGTAVVKATADEAFAECKVTVYSGKYSISGKEYLIDSNAKADRSAIDHELGETWTFNFNSSEGAEYGNHLRIVFPLSLLGEEIGLTHTYEGSGSYPYWSISHWMNQNEKFRAVFYNFGTECPTVYDGEMFEDKGVKVTSGKMKVSKTGYGTYAATLECRFSDGETISLEWEGTADFS